MNKRSTAAHLGIALAMAAATATAQGWRPPVENERCPSK